MDLEAIELHKLAMLIESKGGKVLDLNTDCISCSFPNDILPFELTDGKNISGYYYKNGEPKYKLENKFTRLQVQRKAQYKRENVYTYEPKHWNIFTDVKDNDFQPLVNQIFELNKSAFITGCAGTGKSELIRQIKLKLDAENKTYICLAPTNLSALNIKGVTIHKFVAKLKNMDSLYNMNYDYIFVDEISMLQEVFYKLLIILKQMKPNIKFIIVGDMQQLAPIKDRIDVFDYDFDYENSTALMELCDCNKLVLSVCRRADEEFFSLCGDINNITHHLFKSEFTDRHLAFTNKKRIEINKTCMNIHNPDCETSIIIEKNMFDPNSQEITVYPSLPIISKHNDKKFDIVNNEQFVVQELKENGMFLIKNEERELEITKEQFRNIFYPAYCITIFSSQGATFNFPYTIHEWPRLSKKLKYVSLTRSTCKAFVNII